MAPHRPASLLAALAAAAALAACATPQTTTATTAPAAATPVVIATPLPGSPSVSVRPVVAALPRPPSFPQPWDGSYQGGSTLLHGAPPDCPPSRPGVIEVGDSTLYYAYTPGTIFTTLVAADGTLHGVAAAARLDGKIGQNWLQMTITTPTCQTQYAGHYIWNHSYPPQQP